MFRMKTLFFLIFIILWSYAARGQRVLTWQSLTARYNPAYVKYADFNITQPHNMSFNAEVNFLAELPCETIITLEIKAPQPGKKILTSMLKLKYELRDILQGVRNKFLKILYESLEKYSNLPKKCSVKPNFLWYLHNYSVPIGQFPVILSELNFLTILKITRPNNDFILQSILKGRIECKERKRFDCGYEVRRG